MNYNSFLVKQLRWGVTAVLTRYLKHTRTQQGTAGGCHNAPLAESGNTKRELLSAEAALLG